MPSTISSGSASAARSSPRPWRKSSSGSGLGARWRETAGSLAAEDYPEWETPEKISAWVREMRAFDNESTNRKLARFRSS